MKLSTLSLIFFDNIGSTATQTVTMDADLELDVPDEGRTFGLWHHPPRSLNVCRPDCLVPIKRENLPFVKRRDHRILFVRIDDAGEGDSGAFPETDIDESGT